MSENDGITVDENNQITAATPAAMQLMFEILDMIEQVKS